MDAARRVPIDPHNPAVAPFLENGRVMLPVRFIAESLGLEVTFGTEDLNGAQVQAITIKTKSSNEGPPKPPGHYECIKSHWDWLRGEVWDEWKWVPDVPYR